jgi:hypothetical protein
MPFKLFHSKLGFFVADGKGKKFSNHGLTKENALKQREAIAISEASKKHKPVSYYFAK